MAKSRRRSRRRRRVKSRLRKYGGKPRPSEDYGNNENTDNRRDINIQAQPIQEGEEPMPEIAAAPRLERQYRMPQAVDDFEARRDAHFARGELQARLRRQQALRDEEERQEAQMEAQRAEFERGLYDSDGYSSD